MWLFKKRPKHISLESLSEFLDGGLSDADIRKIEDHLRACESCTVELDSLRDTVGLLRQTPVLPTARDFTFAQAPESAPEPHAPVASVGFQGFRVPVWAYGAAASVAVVAFAVTLSIDVTRGPGDSGGALLTSPESRDSFGTTLADPEDSPTGVPMPPTTTPAPQQEPPGVTAMPVAPTSALAPTPMAEMAMIEPTTTSTQTPQPAAFSMGEADREDSEPDMVMSRAVEPTSGAKAQVTGAPTSAAPPGDVAETRADALTYSPTTMPAPKPTSTPRPTAVPAPKPTSTPRPTATSTPKPTDTPRPTATPTPRTTPTPLPTSTPMPLPTSIPAPTAAPHSALDPGAARESADITTEEVARMRESLGTDQGISVWWIVEGVLAALALGLVVLLALKLRARRGRVS